MTDIADTFEAGGVVQARTTATITARILAPVSEVRVAPGDRVHAGQVLVVLDGRDLGAHARSARAAALAADQSAAAAASEQQAADAALALARATHERIVRPARQAIGDGAGTRRCHRRAARGRSARGRRGRPGAGRRVGVESARAASEAAGTTESFALDHGAVRRRRHRQDGRAGQHGGARHAADAPGRYPWLPARSPRGRVADRTDLAGATVPVSLDAGTGGAPTTVSGTVAEISRAVDADARAFLVKIALPDTAGPALGDVRPGALQRSARGAR